MIEIDHVRKVYRQGRQEIVALDDISLSVGAGEIYGVIGESGAGKSTLIRCVNRLEEPTSGAIRVDGEDITGLRGRQLRQLRHETGMIFQGFNLLSSRTVAQNIALPLEVSGVSRRERTQRVAELISLVGLDARANAYPARLSGGQKQRVGIARALAASPKVLLSDEATSALDPQTTATILALLRDLNRRLNLTILLITHEMDVVRSICDRVAVIESGRIVEQGSVAELALQPASRIGSALFPQVARETIPANLPLVTIPLAEDADVTALFATLRETYAVSAQLVGGGIEPIGDRRLGQLTLAIDPSPTSRHAEALVWLERAYPGAVIR